MKPFHKSISLLLKLHELDPTGDADSPEVDAIRDGLEEPWKQMSKREKDAWGEVSELLRKEAER